MQAATALHAGSLFGRTLEKTGKKERGDMHFYLSEGGDVC